jgi:hypothetical protein
MAPIEDRIADLLATLNNSYDGFLKDAIFDNLSNYFPKCATMACAVSNTSLRTKGGKSYRGVRSNKALTLAERLDKIGYSPEDIEAGLQAMLLEAQGVQGGRKSLVSFAVGGLAHSFNRDCSSGLSDLSTVVDAIIGKDDTGFDKKSMPPAVKKALEMLDTGGLVANQIISMKKMVEEEKKLAKAVKDEPDTGAKNKAFSEYQLFMQALLIMCTAAGRNAVAVKEYLTSLKGEANDAAATGATGPPAGGRQSSSFGGRHGSSKAARLEALKTALLVGDVKYLAMLDMTDVKLSAADRMVAAQTSAQYRGASLDKFEAGIHSALGGRGLSALRVAGLL